MISADHPLPISRQAELMGISRSNVYYLSRPTPEADLVLMRRMDELHLNHPFAGARMLRDLLKLEGFNPDGHPNCSTCGHPKMLHLRGGVAA